MIFNSFPPLSPPGWNRSISIDQIDLVLAEESGRDPFRNEKGEEEEEEEEEDENPSLPPPPPPPKELGIDRQFRYKIGWPHLRIFSIHFPRLLHLLFEWICWQHSTGVG